MASALSCGPNLTPETQPGGKRRKVSTHNIDYSESNEYRTNTDKNEYRTGRFRCEGVNCARYFHRAAGLRRHGDSPRCLNWAV
jgi:hypothetical protein